VRALRVELFGSLAATGAGHGTPGAVLAGLLGHTPEEVPCELSATLWDLIGHAGKIDLLGRGQFVPFEPERDLLLRRGESLPGHPNGLRFSAWVGADAEPVTGDFYSVGGGFIATATELAGPVAALGSDEDPPAPFGSARELLARCGPDGSVSAVMLANECARRDLAEITAGLLRIWQVMAECVERGSVVGGELPGGLRVRRRAPELAVALRAAGAVGGRSLELEWVTQFAMAVNEENAAGGRVVTAPTNGAAGIVPAVLKYYLTFVPGADEDGICRFLLTAAAIGSLFKQNASISGAEVGCQGEVGSACSMAAAGLAEVLGGTPAQVENAAEIAMEHHLGLTCDPVGGLVQIPCIERNGMAAVQAIAAARLALLGSGQHQVSLDQVIETMRQTGRDMSDKYKETSLGGLAVNLTEC
jgi:L-serine dehydratase